MSYNLSSSSWSSIAFFLLDDFFSAVCLLVLRLDFLDLLLANFGRKLNNVDKSVSLSICGSYNNDVEHYYLSHDVVS